MCGVSAGSSAKITARKRNERTLRPSTAKHTVNGVESSRPTGPQTQIQNSAETSSANEDTPVRRPNTSGSMNHAVTKSRARNSTSVCTVSAQPGKMANASEAGINTDSSVPTYGTKRSTAVKPPHNAG